MKLNRIFYLILMLAVVFTFASCGLFGGDSATAEYTVEFNSDGGSAVDSQTVAEGATATKPADPTKVGYTFIGWFNGDAEWSFDTPVTGNLVLTARWEKNAAPCTHADKNDDLKCDLCGVDFEDGAERYTVTYMDGNKKLNLTPNTYTADTTNFKLPTAPAKEHYNFMGWYSDSSFTNKVETLDVKTGANIVLYAKYVPLTYKVTYMLDEGVNAEANLEVYTIENLPFTFAEPTRADYNFVGWYLDANCTIAITSIYKDIIGDITVYAKWELAPIKHTVTYLDLDGNVLGTMTFYENDGNKDHEIDDYELEGYIFLGWADVNDASKLYDFIPAGTKVDLELKALMVSEDSAIDITYYINGKVYKELKFPVGEGTQTLTVEQAGYTFSGWYNNENLTGNVVTSIPANTTTAVELYASLTPITYTVKYFDGENELTDLAPTTYVISEDNITLPAVPAKEGYVVVGWYTADGVKLTSIAANTYGDLTLYARYEAQTFYVTYYLNGGENDERNVSIYSYGNLPTLYAPLTRNGYLFAGWYTDASFSGTAVEDFDDCAYRNVTLYAKWIPITSDNGGDETLTPEDSWAD